VVIASNSILGVAALNSNSLFLFLHLGVKTRVLLVASALSRWFFSVVIASNPTLTVLSFELFLHDSVCQCQVGWFREGNYNPGWFRGGNYNLFVDFSLVILAPRCQGGWTRR
jgi:hypothetical protein